MIYSSVTYIDSQGRRRYKSDHIGTAGDTPAERKNKKNKKITNPSWISYLIKGGKTNVKK